MSQPSLQFPTGRTSVAVSPPSAKSPRDEHAWYSSGSRKSRPRTELQPLARQLSQASFRALLQVPPISIALVGERRPVATTSESAAPGNDDARGQAGIEENNDQHGYDAESIGKSTRSEDQRQSILALLRKGPKTTFDLRAEAGAMQAPTRLHELRLRGYRILTQRVEAADESGLVHTNVARYVLLGEPKEDAR